MKTGRATEAHMYYQAFRRSCRANASVIEGRHSGVRGCFAGAAAVEYAERLYAAVEDKKGLTLPKTGRVKALMFVSAGSTWERLDSVSSLSHTGCASRDLKAVKARVEI